MANGMQAYSGAANNSAVAANSPQPYIKNEPQDDSGRFSIHQYSHHPDAYSMSPTSHFQTQHGGFSDSDFGAGDSIDPSELSVQTGFNMQPFPAYPSTQGVSSYMGNGSSIHDDELRAIQTGDFVDLDHSPESRVNGQSIQFYSDMNGHKNGNGPQNIDTFSHTPENAPVGSPFIRSFPQEQYRRLYDDGPAGSPSSYNSPAIGSDSTQDTDYGSYMIPGKRKPRAGERSERSPSVMSPKTPGLGGLSLGGGPVSSSLPAQPMHITHRHHKSLSSQWDGTPGSFMDSPLSSPSQGPMHTQMSEAMYKGKQAASLPAKVDMNGTSGNSVEAKRRRRRESHNMVERRRRDNINERIQELSHLVPHHRLEDEKVRKHLLNSGSLSPTTAGASGSPTRATSMLAGGMGRRASTSAASGIAAGEEKDKGPNKGDILNGAVGWTRDLMWAMHQKLEQEKEIRELVARLGGTYPFGQSEEEKRMASELQAAIVKNGPHNFRYSRAPGSNLRVPEYTDYAGQPINDSGSDRLSPAGSTGKPMPNGGSSRGTPQKYWNDPGVAFKEEDEYNGMDMS